MSHIAQRDTSAHTVETPALAHRRGAKNGQRFLIATLLLFMIWLLLTGSLAWDELLAGLFASMLTAWIAQKHLMILDDIRWSVSMPFYLAQFLAQFCFALLLANLDMARRILSPSLPINPALVEVETRLQSPLGKLMLANSITLTPGTLTVDIEAQHLLVHWVDSSSGTDLPHATAIIARRFEHSLAALFY